MSELNFDKVEPVQEETETATAGVGDEASQPECGVCERALDVEHWQVSGGPVAGAALVCTPCRGKLEVAEKSGSGSARALRSTAFGLGAAALGTLVYWGVIALTGYEIGLISIAVGFAVGIAVGIGNGNRGGRGYQFLAAGLTYLSIVAAWIPGILDALSRDETGAVVDTGLVERALMTLFAFGLAIVSPFISLASDPVGGILGILILGFGVLQAWRMNAGSPLVFEGPLDPIAAARPAPATSNDDDG